MSTAQERADALVKRTASIASTMMKFGDEIVPSKEEVEDSEEFDEYVPASYTKDESGLVFASVDGHPAANVFPRHIVAKAREVWAQLFTAFGPQIDAVPDDFGKWRTASIMLSRACEKRGFSAFKNHKSKKVAASRSKTPAALAKLMDAGFDIYKGGPTTSNVRGLTQAMKAVSKVRTDNDRTNDRLKYFSQLFKPTLAVLNAYAKDPDYSAIPRSEVEGLLKAIRRYTSDTLHIPYRSVREFFSDTDHSMKEIGLWLHKEAQDLAQFASGFRKMSSVKTAAPDVGQYRNLGDAAAATNNPKYQGRGTTIWYMKPGMSRDLGMGSEFLLKHNIPLPDPRNLKKTHTQLGTISERNTDRIFEMMQGENWSPGGEARSLIRRLGLVHTSMSVGDVIALGNKYFMVDRLGDFYPLSTERNASTEKNAALPTAPKGFGFFASFLRKIIPLASDIRKYGPRAATVGRLGRFVDGMTRVRLHTDEVEPGVRDWLAGFIWAVIPAMDIFKAYSTGNPSKQLPKVAIARFLKNLQLSTRSSTRLPFKSVREFADNPSYGVEDLAGWLQNEATALLKSASKKEAGMKTAAFNTKNPKADDLADLVFKDVESKVDSVHKWAEQDGQQELVDALDDAERAFDEVFARLAPVIGMFSKQIAAIYNSKAASNDKAKLLTAIRPALQRQGFAVKHASAGEEKTAATPMKDQIALYEALVNHLSSPAVRRQAELYEQYEFLKAWDAVTKALLNTTKALEKPMGSLTKIVNDLGTAKSMHVADKQVPRLKAVLKQLQQAKLPGASSVKIAASPLQKLADGYWRDNNVEEKAKKAKPKDSAIFVIDKETFLKDHKAGKQPDRENAKYLGQAIKDFSRGSGPKRFMDVVKQILRRDLVAYFVEAPDEKTGRRKIGQARLYRPLKNVYTFGPWALKLAVGIAKQAKIVK